MHVYIPDSSRMLIVKMFNINREWDKTNTVSELLHFLWCKKKYIWNAQ